jgi:hypothetical protein
MSNEELWKPVVDYEGLYEVSNHGRVRSWVNNAGNKRHFSKLLIPDLLRGYARVSLSKNGVITRLMVHQLVLNAFMSTCPHPGWQASHKDGNPLNNHVDNLCWESCIANNERKFTHGTLLIGEAHGRAKLTEDLVLEIRSLFATGLYSLRKLAAEYKVDRGTITQVVIRRTWTHI